MKWLALLALLTLTLTACSKSDKPAAGTPAGTEAAAHSHEGWWCAEHGVPEGECVQCDPKLAASFKEKGDWCAKHNVPDSQCFVCHPENEAKQAEKYEVKYGKAPPKREEEKK